MHGGPEAVPGGTSKQGGEEESSKAVPAGGKETQRSSGSRVQVATGTLPILTTPWHDSTEG